MYHFWGSKYYSIRVGGKNPIKITPDNGERSIGRFACTKYAFDIYGPEDDRGSAFACRYYWIGDTLFLDTSVVEKAGNVNWPCTRKWDYANPDDPNSNTQYGDQVYLRSADDWLLLAEADYDLHDLQAAADAINTLRARAHATLITSDQVTLDFILDERSRELFSEEERRYTLLRTRTWLERTGLYNHVASPNITPRDTLLPISQNVIDPNIGFPIKQNPGY